MSAAPPPDPLAEVPPGFDAADLMLHRSPAVRALLWLAGTLALGLAVLGAILPGLPTTPFVLLAAACYARASPRFYEWLLRNRLFGPLIIEWRRYRSISRRIKWVAIGSMTVTVSFSVWFFAGRPWVQGLLTLTVLATAIWIWRIPSRQ